MKSFIRLLAACFSLVWFILTFSACGEKAESTDVGKTATGEFDVADVDWSVDEGIADGERYVMLSYTNNSQYTVTGLEIYFKEKSGIAEEEKTTYFNDLKTRFNIDENDEDQANDFKELMTKEISMSVRSKKVCSPKESVSNEMLCYYKGYYYVKNADHFKLVEPDMATVRYIYENKIYTVSYDFKSKKHTKDSKTETAFYWTDKEIGNVIPRPQAQVVSCDTDNIDLFSFNVFGWELEDFNAYVKSCREKGFTVDVSEHEGYYSADSESGFNFYAYFDEDDCEASVTVKKISDDSESGAGSAQNADEDDEDDDT